MKKFMRAVASVVVAGAMLASGPAAAGWEASTRFTAAPLYLGDATVVESKPKFTLLNFCDCTPTAFRFVRPGRWGSLSLERAKSVADAFMRGIASEEFRRGTVQGTNEPYYFAQLRFFLVSVEPDVMVVMPHAFERGRGGGPIAPGLPSTSDYNDQTHALWTQWRTETGLEHLVVHDEAERWINYVELTSTVPNRDDLRVIRKPGAAPVGLREALADPAFPLDAKTDAQHPQVLRFEARR
jgi:hypothetical protein